MFLELKGKNEFKVNYFEMLKYRLAFASLELEGISDDLTNVKQSMKIFNQLQAINYIFDTHKENHFSHYEFTSLLCEVAKRVTGEEVSDFRTTEASVVGSNVERTKPQMIRNNLWFLIDDYNYQLDNCKSEDELYEIEALFHIRLLHIHPFEDGNGRTARVLLAYNMCKNSLAPCIISNEHKKMYCDLIENGDAKNLAKLFKELSENELNTMISLYKELDEKGLIKENNFTEEQKVKYMKLKKQF